MSPKDALLFMEAMQFFDDEAFDFGGHPWFVRWRCLKMFRWEVGIKLFLHDAVGCVKALARVPGVIVWYLA